MFFKLFYFVGTEINSSYSKCILSVDLAIKRRISAKSIDNVCLTYIIISNHYGIICVDHTIAISIAKHDIDKYAILNITGTVNSNYYKLRIIKFFIRSK